MWYNFYHSYEKKDKKYNQHYQGVVDFYCKPSKKPGPAFAFSSWPASWPIAIMSSKEYVPLLDVSYTVSKITHRRNNYSLKKFS
jgi:hypothetical protein